MFFLIFPLYCYLLPPSVWHAPTQPCRTLLAVRWRPASSYAHARIHLTGLVWRPPHLWQAAPPPASGDREFYREAAMGNFIGRMGKWMKTHSRWAIRKWLSSSRSFCAICSTTILSQKWLSLSLPSSKSKNNRSASSRLYGIAMSPIANLITSTYNS
jgi:hypothetical protein